MYPTYKFKVNMLDFNSIYSSPQLDNLESVLYQLMNATVWIEGIDRPLKHGDVFTVSGELALKIKALYADKTPSVLVYVDIPDVADLELSSDGTIVTLTWTPNEDYSTDVEYRTDDGLWNNLNWIIPGVGSAIIDAGELGVSFQVRMRFTDTEGNFSKNYTTNLIDVDFGINFSEYKLYGLTHENEETLDKNSIYQLNLDEGDNLIKSFEVPYIKYENSAMTWNGNDSAIYILSRVTTGDNEVSTNLLFEKYFPTTTVREEITLSDTGNIEEVRAMCLHTDETTYLIVSAYSSVDGDAFYTLTLDGTLTLLKGSIGRTVRGLVSMGGDLFGLLSGEGSIILYDPATGDEQLNEAEPIITPITFDDEVSSFDGWAVGLFEHQIGMDTYFGSFMRVSQGEAGYNAWVYINPTTGLTQIEHILDYRLMSFIKINYLGNPESFVGLTEDFDIDNLYPETIYLINTPNNPNAIIKLSFTEEDEDGAIAWNRDDGYIYYIARRNFNTSGEENFDQLTFKRFREDIGEGEIQDIEITGDLHVDGIEYHIQQSNVNINDGGSDMYDGGNFLATNISLDNSQTIVYTHTQTNDAETFPSDGAIVDGTAYFGAGSEYFTNCYPGLFVMCAKDINITRFLTAGNLGADGSGSVTSYSFQKTVSDQLYTCYFKGVSDEYPGGDPTVNHIMIVPGDGNGIEHIYGINTDDDYHELSGLVGINSIYYILFATKDESEEQAYIPTQEVVESVAETFLGLLGNTLAPTLANLNASFTTITNEIPFSFAFTDEGSGDNFITIGEIDGLLEPRAMVYIGMEDDFRKKFLVSDNEFGLFKLLSNSNDVDNGIVVENLGTTPMEIDSMAYFNDVVYAISGPFLVKIDPDTGEFLNEVEDEKFDIVLTLDENFIFISALGVKDNQLYGLLEYDSETSQQRLVIIDTETGICTFSDESPDVLYDDMTGVGVNPPAVEPWFISYNYNEITSRFRLQVYSNAPELNVENLEVQYNLSGYQDSYGNPPQSGWLSTEIEVIEDENVYIDITSLDANDFDDLTIRVRFVNPDSAWVYTYWD